MRVARGLRCCPSRQYRRCKNQSTVPCPSTHISTDDFSSMAQGNKLGSHSFPPPFLAHPGPAIPSDNRRTMCTSRLGTRGGRSLTWRYELPSQSVPKRPQSETLGTEAEMMFLCDCARAMVRAGAWCAATGVADENQRPPNMPAWNPFHTPAHRLCRHAAHAGPAGLPAASPDGLPPRSTPVSCWSAVAARRFSRPLSAYIAA